MTASGGRFNAILLPNVSAMDAPTLRKLSLMQGDGDPIYFLGATPVQQPGFDNATERDEEVRTLVSELLENGAQLIGGGIGKLVTAIQRHTNAPVRIAGAKSIRLYPKALGERQWIYFFANQSPDREVVRLNLAQAGEAWWFDALEGRAWPAIAKADQLELGLSGFSSRFLILGIPLPDNLSSQPSTEVLAAQGEQWWPLTNWTLSDGDITLALADLEDWREIPEMTFSRGPGVYTHTFVLEQKSATATYVLDLGLVHGSALVRVGGADVCRASIPPFTCDISDALQESDNRIEVEVSPPLVNTFISKGLAGDTQYEHMLRTKD